MPPATSFGARLAEAVAARGPLCAGIDPSAELLAKWDLPDDPGGLREFCRRAVAAFAGEVPVVKPQSAFFERHGAEGVAVLAETVALAREAGALVLLDAKRGDIGSTSAAYAEAYVAAAAPIRVDAMTVNPYLGLGALSPFVEACRDSGTGLFFLARTSNPDGARVQDATLPDGRTVAHDVIGQVAALNGDAKSGSFGIVFGATVDTAGYGLETFRGPVLAPGLGAQGATPADVGRRFRDCAGIVLPNVSRAILVAGPDEPAMRDEARALGAACREALGR